MSVNASATSLPQYLLLLRGTKFEERLSMQEMQVAMGNFTEWVSGLALKGKLKIGQPLAHEGKFISGTKERTVSDGPFAESKEAVGGYLLLEVADMDEAVSIGRECPLLDWGGQVEVRPIVQQCPTMQQVDARLAASAAAAALQG